MARRLLNNDPTTERATQQRMITRIGNAHRDEVRKAIKAAMKEAASRYERDGGSTSGVSGALESQRSRVLGAVRAMHRAAFDTLGRRLLESAAAKAGAGAGEFKQEVSDDVADAFDEAARAFLAEQSADAVATIMSTTGSQFESIITQGVREGAGTDEIARRVRVQSETLSRIRSQVIARTETHRAANKGQTEAARASGVANRKEWLSANDDRVRDDRFDHRAADGEIATLDQPFTRTGEPLDYPGDASGSGGNTINCRCATNYLAD